MGWWKDDKWTDGWRKQPHKLFPPLASELIPPLRRAKSCSCNKTCFKLVYNVVLEGGTWQQRAIQGQRFSQDTRWNEAIKTSSQTRQNSKRQFEFPLTNSKTWYAHFFISLGEMVSRQIIILIIIICRTLTIKTNESGFCTIPYLQLLGHFIN